MPEPRNQVKLDFGDISPTNPSTIGMTVVRFMAPRTGGDIVHIEPLSHELDSGLSLDNVIILAMPDRHGRPRPRPGRRRTNAVAELLRRKRRTTLHDGHGLAQPSRGTVWKGSECRSTCE